MRPARACLCAAVLAAAALAAPARAAGSFADREAARTLSGQAYEQFEARRYRRAIELFQQAEAHFHAPPHLLYTARAQFKLGLFLEARATFERVAAEKLAADAPAPFKEAQTSARAELAEVEALTPGLVVTLPDPPPPGAHVLLDGEPLAAADLGHPLPRNPGAHALVAEAPGLGRIERTVVLTAGGGDERVDLSPSARTAPQSLVPAVVAFSVGGAGLIAGTTAAILLRNARSGTTALRVTEVAGFTAGGLAAGTGVILLVLRARSPRSASSAPVPVEVRVGVGPGSLSVSGVY